MKTNKILLVLTSLLLSVWFGNALAHVTCAELMLGSINFAPLAFSSSIFVASFIPFTPVGSLATYVNVSVTKPGSNKGAGGNMKDTIIIFDMADVLSFPARDSKGVLIADNIVMKPNAYMIELYQTQDKFKKSSDGEGDNDAKGIIQGFEMSHPGSELEIKEFRFNWLNRNVGIIVTSCSTGRKELLGSPCAPLQMVFKSEHDKDKNGTVFTFKSLLKGPDIAEYQGTLTLATETGTVAADAVSVNLANGEGRYQLTDGTIAPVELTGCSNAADGLTFTLVGSGGANPSTVEATPFMDTKRQAGN